MSEIFTLYTVPHFAERHEAFCEGGLRWLIFNSEDRKDSTGKEIPGNGLAGSGAIVRIGRRVLIHEAKFFDWATTNGAQAVYVTPSNPQLGSGVVSQSFRPRRSR